MKAYNINHKRFIYNCRGVSTIFNYLRKKLDVNGFTGLWIHLRVDFLKEIMKKGVGSALKQPRVSK